MGGGGGADLTVPGLSPDKTIINRIMLRFRPIAPKPVSGSNGLQSVESRDSFTGTGRRKRRYVSGCGKKSSAAANEKKGSSRSENNKLKTLRLMPETSSGSPEKERDLEPLDLTVSEIQRPRIEVTESRVTVLSLTDACMEGRYLGCTDEDRWRNLEQDTCPGFISDSNNNVVWSNGAYRRMAAGDEAAEVAVTMAVRDSLLLPVICPAFACMVRVQYTWREERDHGKAMVVPCDVWRMNCGGHAWRLDVKAGLSLGWSCVD